MFILTMPVSFKRGDTAPCTVNGKAELVKWDKELDRLSILPTDWHNIMQLSSNGRLQTFFCDDAEDAGQ